MNNGHKLIYILNHYSSNSSQHFFHIINLLEKIAENGVKIVLVIEKCDDIPSVRNKNIKVVPQKNKLRIGRLTELFRILYKLQKSGYNKSFVRISWVAAIISIMVGFVSNLETYYWLSGQGGIEKYKTMKLGINKIKYIISARLPFWFIKTFVYRFVTGPESMRDYMRETMGVSQDKIIILYNDIDTYRFSETTMIKKISYKDELGFPMDKKIIFFAHRFSPVRKTLFYIPYIISEFFKAESPLNYHFIIAGSGPEERELKKAIETSDVSNFITLLGSVPNGNIDRLYKASDIFINPTYSEGFPRVIIEAMACGLPIVTTDAGGISDILGNFQKEFMICKEDRVLFANKLSEIVRSSQKQELLRKENISQVQKYSTENVAKMYIEAIFNNSN